jgi:hypothetical protein
LYKIWNWGKHYLQKCTWSSIESLGGLSETIMRPFRASGDWNWIGGLSSLLG